MYKERLMRELTEEVGLDLAEAEQVLRDDDLWLLHPVQRFGFPDGEESVREWETTVRLVRGLAEGFTNDAQSLAMANKATVQLIWDAQARAQEALRRARERAAGKS